MTFKNQVLYTIIALILAFLAGKYTASPVEVKSVVTQKETDKTVEDKVCHIQTKTVVVESPSGEKKTETTTDTSYTDKITEIKKDTTTSKTDTINKRSVINVSALAAVSSSFIPKYGISIQKEVIGPITVGGFILTNGEFGASIGINF